MAGGDENDHVIDHPCELVGSLRAGDGCGEHDPTGPARTSAHNGGTGRGTCCDSVVHDNGGTPDKVKGAAVLSIAKNSSIEFELFLRRHARKLLFGDTQMVTDLALSSRDATFGEGAHREFGLGRHADLAHDDDIERRLQDSRDFVGNDYSPSWQSQDDRGVNVHVRAEANSKQPSGFGSIDEPLHTFGLASRFAIDDGAATHTDDAI